MAGICPCTFGNSISAALGNLKNAKRLNPDREKQTAPAELISRRVVRRNEMFENDPWLYLAMFRLENGGEMELRTTEEVDRQLTDGSRGTLVWCGDELVSFP